MKRWQAVLLGVGAGGVLGLAGSAHAAAAPADDDSSRQHARPAQVSYRDERPRAASAVSARPSVAARRTGAPAATVRRPAPRTSSIAPAAPSTVALPDSRGRLTTIYKGTHFTIPNPWRLWLTEVAGDATFTADSRYDLGDSDQYDWNKLTGITWTPLLPNYDAAMVVWRYNLDNGLYEVGPFFNDATAFVFPTRDEIISVPVDQTFGFYVDYDGITITYGDTVVRKARPEDITPNFWTSAKITGWFGGNRVAPKTVSYYIRM